MMRLQSCFFCLGSRLVTGVDQYVYNIYIYVYVKYIHSGFDIAYFIPGFVENAAFFRSILRWVELGVR